MQIKGTDARFSIEQPDGSWQSIPVHAVIVTQEEDLDKERIAVKVQHDVYFEIPIKCISPRDPRDFLVSIYESVLHKKCPGSWSTKRLEKKRLKALEAYFSPLDPSAAV